MLDLAYLRRFIEAELHTDRFSDDVTARLLDPHKRATGIVRAKEAGVFSGEAICAAFPIPVEFKLAEGASLEKGSEVCRFEASASTCLSAERTLVNFLSHTCGVATYTRRFVDAVKPLPVKILATRKTLPGLRDLELAAIRAGGAHVHRRNLSDGILIKDNHIAMSTEAELLKRAQEVRSPLHRIEIEVQNLDQLKRALASKVDVVMLDNMSLAEMAEAVKLVGGKCEIEISGGVNLESIRKFAELGVNYISVGRITHSAPSLDLSMDIE